MNPALIRANTTRGPLVVYMVEISPTFRAPDPRRRSRHINRKPGSNLWHAFNMAEDRGLPFTLHVTINFAHTACTLGDESGALCELITRCFAPWWRRPSRKHGSAAPGHYAYAWVMEAGGGHTAAHWALHMPDARLDDFLTRLPTWLEAVTGGEFNGQALHHESAYNPRGLRLYMLKGVDPTYAAFCKIEHKPQGEVTGKRSGFSRSLGPTARQRSGYRPRRLQRS
jgi:hypothetical protein